MKVHDGALLRRAVLRPSNLYLLVCVRSELDELIIYHDDADVRGIAIGRRMPSGKAGIAGSDVILAETYFAERARSNLAVWPILPIIWS